MRKHLIVLVAAFAATGILSAKAGEIVSLNGAGATFPFPLYSKWVSEYNRIHPDVQINYQSVGSGAGIRQITERTVDFGASDVPMTDEQLSRTPAKLVHIPTALGAVVILYNLDGVPTGLKLSPEVLADIFLGEITQWNDPRISTLNPEVKLPAKPITVSHRSDGSGTTAVFTDYLSRVSETWRKKVSTGTSVNWPVGLGGKGNEGVTGQVKITPGAVGYVELAYAKQSKVPYAAIRNRAGRTVTATIEGITAAAANLAADMPDDFRISIVDPPGDDAYPISAFTYILVYEDNSDAVRGGTLARFLWWAVHEGQKSSPPLDYAPLPAALVTQIESKLRTLRSGGRPLLPGGL